MGQALYSVNSSHFHSAPGGCCYHPLRGAPGHREDQSPTRGHEASTWGSQCQPTPFPVCWADPTLLSLLGPGPQKSSSDTRSFSEENQPCSSAPLEGRGRPGSSVQSRRCGEVPWLQGGGVPGPQRSCHGRLPLICLQKPPPSSTAPSWAVLTGSPALGDPLGSARGGPEGEMREAGEGTGPHSLPPGPSGCCCPPAAHSALGVCRLITSPEP